MNQLGCLCLFCNGTGQRTSDPRLIFRSIGRSPDKTGKTPNQLQQAMDNLDLNELDAAADAVGREAVQIALAAPKSDPAIEAQRQRDLDAALADAVEIVARQRVRLGRRACSRHDGETIRRVFELLRSLMAESSDPGFQ